MEKILGVATEREREREREREKHIILAMTVSQAIEKSKIVVFAKPRRVKLPMLSRRLTAIVSLLILFLTSYEFE